MPQIFHPSANTIARVSIFGAVFFIATLFWLFYVVSASHWITQAHVARETFICMRARTRGVGGEVSKNARPTPRFSSSCTSGSPPRSRRSTIRSRVARS
jgi:hypothetical protein